MPELSSLTERVAVVTGAASGIGSALANRLAEQGFTVALLDIDSTALADNVAGLRTRDLPAVGYVVDVRDSGALAATASTIATDLGNVSMLLTVAGVETVGRLWEIDPAQWSKVMGVNVDGVYATIRAFLPGMIRHGAPAHIVGLSSIGALTTGAHQAPYIASKHAVLALLECLAAELAADKVEFVGVSAVIAGPVRTGIFTAASSADADGPGAEHLAAMRDYIDSSGADPNEIATIVLDGVARGDLYVHTHPSLSRGLLSQRFETLLAGVPTTR